MSKDLTNVTATNASTFPSTTYNPPADNSEKSEATSEEIAAQMESKSANLGNGLGEALGKTSVGKFLQGVSTGISYVADTLVNLVPSLPVASAEPLRNPSNSPQIKTAEQLKSPTQKPKIIGRYDLEELQVSEDKIYFNCEKGDWFFSPLRFEPLSKLDIYNKAAAVYLVKRSELKDMIARDNYEDFHALVLKARANIMKQINEKQDLISSLFLRELSDLFFYKSPKYLGDTIHAICKKFNFKHSAEFESKIQKFFSENLKAISKITPENFSNSDLINHDLKHIIVDHISALQTDNAIKSLWKKIKQHDLSPNIKEKELLAKYRTIEKLDLENEQYFDRIEKFRIISSDPNFKCIIGGKDSIYEAVTSAILPNIVWVFDVAAQGVITHELLHMYDNQICLAENNGYSINGINNEGEFKEPCSNDLPGNKKFPIQTKAAFYIDVTRFSRAFSNAIDRKTFIATAQNRFLFFTKEGYKSSLENIIKDTDSLAAAFKPLLLMQDNKPIEIIPYVTQYLTPTQMILFCPNIAVTRSKTIYNDKQPGSVFYMAIMQCDINSIKDIIKKNPTVLNEEYDGIKLHELPKILTLAGYDKFVDKSFKKDNKNNYADVSSLVEKEYKLYKESNVKKLADKKEQSSKEKEL